MTTAIEVSVLVVGGGPVGLTTAVELSHFGIDCLVIEKNASTTRHPKMDLTNGRSMELFRRTGLADKIREVSIDPGNSFDIIWTSDLKPGSHEIMRFPYHGARDEFWRRRAVNDGTLTLEEPLRVSQIVIEPVMRKAAEESAGVDVKFSWALENFEQNEDSVIATIVNTNSGERQTIKSRYLIGCDGGGSTVRKQLGIKNEGTPGVLSAHMIHFRSTDYELLQQFGQGWHYQTSWGFVIAQNDIDEWTLHVVLPEGADLNEEVDYRQMVIDYMGKEFDFDILTANPWTAHYLVAEEYRKGRVFMAGDACHQFMPTGGYGMNTGIAEVGNLAWKIAAAVHGWGGERLLDSYPIERRPIARLSWQTSKRHLDVRFKINEFYQQAGDICSNTGEAAKNRLKLGRQIADLGNGENEAWGTEHGYRYEGSPVIAEEVGTPPTFDMFDYRPSTWPGCRLPHMFLGDGTAVYDRLGNWYTLIVTNGADISDFEQAAHAAGIPLSVLRLDELKVAAMYEKSLLLVRPDHHVAWRGDQLPADANYLLNLMTGRV